MPSSEMAGYEGELVCRGSFRASLTSALVEGRARRNAGTAASRGVTQQWTATSTSAIVEDEESVGPGTGTAGALCRRLCASLTRQSDQRRSQCSQLCSRWTRPCATLCEPSRLSARWVTKSLKANSCTSQHSPLSPCYCLGSHHLLHNRHTHHDQDLL